MDILERLKEDHREVQKLMEKIKEILNEKEKKKELFNKFAQEITAHNEAEEKVFYETMMETDEGREESLESFEEHTLAKSLIHQLYHDSLTEEEWNARCKTVFKLVNNHISHEEEDSFKLAKKLFDKDTLTDLAQKFDQAKQDYLKQK